MPILQFEPVCLPIRKVFDQFENVLKQNQIYMLTRVIVNQKAFTVLNHIVDKSTVVKLVYENMIISSLYFSP